MDIVWSPEAQIHMWEAHEVTPEEATEAIEDIDAVWYEPDPASKSGLTSRVVGYSHSRVRILCVIVLPTDEGYQGHQRLARQRHLPTHLPRGSGR